MSNFTDSDTLILTLIRLGLSGRTGDVRMFAERVKKHRPDLCGRVQGVLNNTPCEANMNAILRQEDPGIFERGAETIEVPTNAE